MTNPDSVGGLKAALDFVNRQPCRCMSIAQLGERDYCDRCNAVAAIRNHEVASGLAAEYKAWLACYHAGGDFSEFLSNRTGGAR